MIVSRECWSHSLPPKANPAREIGLSVVRDTVQKHRGVLRVRAVNNLDEAAACSRFLPPLHSVQSRFYRDLNNTVQSAQKLVRLQQSPLTETYGSVGPSGRHGYSFTNSINRRILYPSLQTEYVSRSFVGRQCRREGLSSRSLPNTPKLKEFRLASGCWIDLQTLAELPDAPDWQRGHLLRSAPECSTTAYPTLLMIDTMSAPMRRAI